MLLSFSMRDKNIYILTIFGGGHIAFFGLEILAFL